MKKSILFLFILLITLNFSLATIKLAIVNPIDVFNNSNLGLLSIKKFENNIKPYINKLKKEQYKIIEQTKYLENNFSTMIRGEFLKRKKEIENNKEIFTKKLQVLQKREYIEKDKILKKFQFALHKIINKIAQDKKYDIVFTTQSFLYCNNNINDISYQVLELMNEKYK